MKEKGFNLIGYATSPMGLGEDLRSFALLLECLNIPFSIIDLLTDVQGRLSNNYKNLTLENYDINIYFMSPHEYFNLISKENYSFEKNKLRIGYFLWELEDLPPRMIEACNFIDQIWCPSNFVRKIFYSATNKLTLTLPLPVLFHPGNSFNWRHRLNIPQSAFVCLYIFDIHSTINRKNPQAVVDVFLNFLQYNPNAFLILKINRFDQSNINLLNLFLKHSNIKIIIEILSPSLLSDLYKTSDCYLSLHRSEGFGRTIVEAMQHGLFIVSTDYSGPRDYLSSTNACIVDWIAMPVKCGDYPHLTIDSKWSDPCKESALEQIILAYHKSRISRNFTAKKSVEKYSLINLVNQYKNVIFNYL